MSIIYSCSIQPHQTVILLFILSYDMHHIDLLHSIWQAQDLRHLWLPSLFQKGDGQIKFGDDAFS